jgi:hypothetical protein
MAPRVRADGKRGVREVKRPLGVDDGSADVPGLSGVRDASGRVRNFLPQPSSIGAFLHQAI